ncbi:MAG TPA: iron-sulfur cluster assembly accessory protein [Capillimicrobium sp.]|nr:iron-sulfur cluster assembly accessory protein [Capillimicrobium sp.]
MSDTVTFTDRGAAKMQEVLAAVQDADGAGLRIDVISGGCSGYQYRLALDEPGERDLVFEDRGVRIVVHDEHLPFVRGAEVDYVDDAGGPSFRVNNPNVVYGCGCGNSFVLREEAGATA